MLNYLNYFDINELIFIFALSNKYILVMVTVIRKVDAYTALEQSITVYLVNVSVNPQTPPREVAFASLSEATQFIQDITAYPDKYLKGLFD